MTYRLHPTFPEPIRTVTDRARKFQLRCSGWGIFKIPIEVRLKSGERLQLAHQLQFTFPRDVRAEGLSWPRHPSAANEYNAFC